MGIAPAKSLVNVELPEYDIPTKRMGWAQPMNSSTEQEMDCDEAWLQSVVDAIRKRNLELPAQIFLELYRPLSGIGGAIATVSQPLWGGWIGEERSRRLLKLLEDQKQLECLSNKLGALNL